MQHVFTQCTSCACPCTRSSILVFRDRKALQSCKRHCSPRAADLARAGSWRRRLAEVRRTSTRRGSGFDQDVVARESPCAVPRRALRVTTSIKSRCPSRVNGVLIKWTPRTSSSSVRSTTMRTSTPMRRATADRRLRRHARRRRAGARRVSMGSKTRRARSCWRASPSPGPRCRARRGLAGRSASVATARYGIGIASKSSIELRSRGEVTSTASRGSDPWSKSPRVGEAVAAASPSSRLIEEVAIVTACGGMTNIERDGLVLERLAPRDAGDRVLDLVRRETRGVETADDRAHAGTGDRVDRARAVLLEHAEHADVRRAPRSTARRGRVRRAAASRRLDSHAATDGSDSCAKEGAAAVEGQDQTVAESHAGFERTPVRIRVTLAPSLRSTNGS